MMPLLLQLLATLALTPDAPPLSSCRQELNRIHTVTAPEGRFLLYGDPMIASYLQSLSSRPIIPIYEDAPVAFLHNGATVVSTGLILQAAGEADLLRSLPAPPARSAKARRIAPAPPLHAACSTPSSLSFHELQTRLAADIDHYKYLTTPRLISRTQAPPRQ